MTDQPTVSKRFLEIAARSLEQDGRGKDSFMLGEPGAGLDILKDKLNKYEIKKWVPLVGGTGVGDFMVGEAPNMYRDLANEGPSAAFTPESYRQKVGMGPASLLYGIDERMVPLVGLGSDLVGLATIPKVIAKTGAKAVSKAVTAPTKTSRREFVKKAGAVAGGVVVGGGLLKMASKVAKEGGEQVAKKTSDNVATTVTKKYKYNSLAEYIDDVESGAIHEIRDSYHHEIRASYPNGIKGLSDKEFADIKQAGMTRRMELDAARYKFSKSRLDGLQKGNNPLTKEQALEYLKRGRHTDTLENLDEFSPLAKEEMAGAKALAKEYKIPWPVYVAPIPF